MNAKLNIELLCEETGKPCCWESIDLSIEDDYNWDLRCQDCYRWRDWSKGELK